VEREEAVELFGCTTRRDESSVMAMQCSRSSLVQVVGEVEEVVMTE
jgi:hypothetical protein